ncbi:MAG: DMT family transporter [Ignavibacteriales bacterium]
MTPNSMTGYFHALAAGSTWATTGLFVRYLQSGGMDALSILTWRSLISSHAILLALLLFNRGLLVVHKEDRPMVVIAGVTSLVLGQFTFFYAMAHTRVAIAVILNYTAPLWVTIISRVYSGEPVTRRKALALLVSASGLVLVLGLYDPSSISLGSVPALAVGLASGLFYGIQTLLTKRLVSRYHPLTVNGWTGFAGGWVLLAMACLTLPRVAAPPREAALAMGLFAVGPGIAGFYMFGRSLSLIPATHASITAMIEPVAAAILGFLVLGESLSALQVAGMAMVLGAIVLVTTDHSPAGSGQYTGRRRKDHVGHAA